jgi:hypothetical protein
MPSPFPGMDPYLEAPTEFPSLHVLLVAGTVAQLQPELRSRGYFASPGERVWLAAPGRSILPDTTLIQHRPHSLPPGGGTALADPPVRIRREPFEVHEPYVEIFDAASRRIVTGIEFISPTNKLTRTGRLQYRRKQRDCRRGGIHLVEVDLIRRGKPVVALPFETIAEQGPWDYLVNTVRIPPTDYEFYPIRLTQRLPRILLPLKTGEPDIVLDLQRLLDEAYETGAFADRIDYTPSPVAPLADDDATWIEQLLTDKGLR